MSEQKQETGSRTMPETTIDEPEVRVTAWLPAHMMGGCSNCHSRDAVKEITLGVFKFRLCERCLKALKKAIK